MVFIPQYQATNLDRFFVLRNCCEGSQQSQAGYSFKPFSTFQAAGWIRAQLLTRYRDSSRANDHQATQQVGVRGQFHTLTLAIGNSRRVPVTSHDAEHCFQSRIDRKSFHNKVSLSKCVFDIVESSFLPVCNVIFKIRAHGLLTEKQMTHPNRPILKGMWIAFTEYLISRSTSFRLAVLLLMQVAPGQAYARFGVICRILGGFPVERVDHEYLLPSFAWTAASLSGTEGSHRQRSRCGLLPLPVLLSVSAKYEGPHFKILSPAFLRGKINLCCR